MYPQRYLAEGSKLQLDGTGIQLHTSGGWIEKSKVEGTLQASPDPVLGFQRSIDNEDHFLLEDACADAVNNTKEFILMEEPWHKQVVDRSTIAVDTPDEFGRHVVDASRDVNHDNSPATRVIGESFEAFILENSMDLTIGEGTYLTIDNDYIDGTELAIRIVMEGTDANNPQSDAGDYILAEDWGSSIMQESGLNIGDYPDVTGDAFIDEGEDWSTISHLLLDGTDSSGSHSGDYVIGEEEPDFVGDSITDSDGASGTVVTSDVGSLVFGTDVVSNKPGYYRNTDHHISDGVIKLQDSYFYQDFSYEVRIGQSVNLYMNELKKAVHPTGFAAFGRVTIASNVAASIQTPTATSVIDYTGDTDLFTPTLASMLDNIFQIQIPRRLEVGRWNEGEVFDRLGLESPYIFRMEDDTGFLTINESGHILQQEGSSDYIVLNGTDGSSSNADSYIYTNVDDAGSFYLGEEDDRPSENLITEDNLNNQRIGTERSSAPEANSELELLQKVKVKVELPQATYYAKAGGWTGGLPLVKDGVAVSSKVEMEDGTSGRTPTIVRDVILLDGVEQGSGSVGDQGSYLQWEDETDADFGSGLSIADLQYRRNDDFVLEQSATFNEIISLEYATDTWVDVNTPNLLLLDRTDGAGTNAGSRVLHQDSVDSYGDDLVLDGTDGSSTNAGAKFVSEDILDGEISLGELEVPYTFVMEGNGLGDTAGGDRLVAEDSEEGGEIILESRFEVFLLEGDTWGRIMSETDGDGAMAQEEATCEGFGQNMVVENATTPQLGGVFHLETVAIEAEDGTGTVAPEINYRESNIVHFTRPSVIRKETVGKIALQDEREPIGVELETETGAGNLVLNGTSGIGANAGSKIQYEKLLHRILEQHHPGFALLDGTNGSSANAGSYIEFEIGTRPPFDYTLEGDDEDATYDSTQTTYDSTQQTYDATT